MVNLTNSHLKELKLDKFHHLGFSTASEDVKKIYGDVKFVCMSGSVSRTKKFALSLKKELKVYADDELVDLCKTDRYVMFKVGPVLLANHGIGIPSTTIILHEIFKLLHYAEAEDVTFFRIGTCGGLGLDAGTVVLTRKAVNGMLQPKHSQIILGKVIDYDTEFKHSLADEIFNFVKEDEVDFPFKIEIGDTMCADDFYEGQARLDGAFCHYDKEEKNSFLKRAHESGVRNMEMESLVFASLCNRANIRACIVCVILLNRLGEEDQIHITEEEHKEFELRPGHIVIEYIKRSHQAKEWFVAD